MFSLVPNRNFLKSGSSKIAMQVVPLSRLASPPNSEIRSIFFKCTGRTHFASEHEKDSFFQRWTGPYREQFKEEILLALNSEGHLMAYLMGCGNSESATDVIAQGLPSFLLFKDLFKDFPAHLHINCDPQFQGQGVGSHLIDAYCDTLREKRVGGVHIVTSPEADNVMFYKKKGFEFQQTGRWKQMALLFMGKPL